MKNTWPTVAAVVGATILQAGLAPHMAVLRVSPNFLVLVVVTLGLLQGPIAGSVTGFVAGLLIDMLGAGAIGPSALVLCVVGYVAGTLSANMFAEGWLLPVTVVFVASLLAEIAHAVLLSVLGEGAPFLFTLGAVVIPAAVYNTALAVLAYPWLARLLRQAPAMAEFRRLA